MTTRALIIVLTLAALAVPAVADAADTVVVPGAVPQRMTALDGTVVWVAGNYPHETLMRRGPDGTVAPVKGAPTAVYPSIDLGHDGASKLVLTYLRCSGSKNCVAYSDDLAGHRNAYKKLVPKRCSLSSAPSRWGAYVAYGLDCSKLSGKPNVHDVSRSGLFVRKGAAAPRHLGRPKDAKKFGVDNINWVDLRGTNVGAAASDIYTYAFAQTIDGTHLRSDFVAASEGDSDESLVGLALGTGGTLWSLVTSSHDDDPNDATIDRLDPTATADSCEVFERLVNPLGDDQADGYRAESMTVDGSTIYLYVPGTGIVMHVFAPTSTCG
jgi:hypothetical protein